MDALLIDGGRPLHGVASASGSKNAALPILAAALLADEPVRLARVPDVTDVHTLSRVLEQLGLAIEHDRAVRTLSPHCGERVAASRVRGQEQLIIQPAVGCDAGNVRASRRLVHRMRASFCVLGPLLAKRGRAIVALPGGCRIGNRPIDLHLRGLAKLGAELRIANGYVFARARRLRGAKVDLAGQHGPTVTGTANVLCAAVLAPGTTIIAGAAREPEIVDLGWFLIRLGARVEGLGTSQIVVRGVDQLGGGDYEIIPDRIEVGTLLVAGAITGGSITVDGVRPDHLQAVLAALETMGAEIDVEDWSITLRRHRPLRPARLVAQPYPGFPTDLQAHFVALACLAAGRSRIDDAVFPQRVAHLAQLRRFGARIARRSNAMKLQTAIDGMSRLRGAEVRASDLRASAALVLAGLAAEGRTTVRGLRHLDRGYERLEVKLAALGARIERVAMRDRVELATGLVG